MRQPTPKICLLLAIVTLLLAGGATPAAAQRLALELNVGDSRPPQAEQVMTKLRSVLSAEYISTPAAIRDMLSSHIWRPGLADADFSNEAFATEINIGSRAFSNGEFSKAQKSLEATLRRARENPLLLVREMKNRQTMLRGLVGLALANKRIYESAVSSGAKPSPEAQAAREKRDATMAELIRSYPEQVISYKSFGREAEALFLSVGRELELQGRGSLSIVVHASEPLTVYLNEVKRDIRRPLTDLVPGIYRVLLQTSTGEAREYRAEILPKQTTNVVIEWDLDAALTLGSWVGFQFATEGARVAEGDLIATLLSERREVTQVATFRVFANYGHVTVVGAVYLASGEELRHGKVEWDAVDQATPQLMQLVDFLDGGAPIANDNAPKASSRPLATVAAVERQRGKSSHIAGKLLVAGGVATMIGGGVLLAIDEDPNKSGPVQPTYRDTAVPGVIALSAGAVITGVGLWLWLRDDGGASNATAGRRRSVPLVAVGQGQVFLGWRGAF